MTGFIIFIIQAYHYALVVGVIAFFYVLSQNNALIVWASRMIDQVLALQGGELYFCAMAAILVLIEIEYLVLKIRRNTKKRYITFDQSSGKVALSVRAIEEFIKKVSCGYSEIKSIQPKVTSKRREVRIKADICILAGCNLPVFAEDFKKNVQSQIQNILGLEKKVTVEMNIEEVADEKQDVFRDKIYQGLDVQ